MHAMLWLSALLSFGDDPAKAGAKASQPAPTGTRQLSPSLAVDFDKRQLVLEAEVVLREGPLELLLCPKRTKEHESILAAEVNPRHFQLALLMLGAEPGRPALFDPVYKPPTGQRIDIRIEYVVAGQKKSVDAREWIRDGKHNKALDADFVFTGSRFQRLPGTDKPVWLGADGDLICVSNFPGSVVDIAVKSSNANADRMFEAWTERIPERGSKVRAIFRPRFDKP